MVGLKELFLVLKKAGTDLKIRQDYQLKLIALKISSFYRWVRTSHRKREERLRKALQARERVEQMEEEKKKRMERSEKVETIPVFLAWQPKRRSVVSVACPLYSGLVAAEPPPHQI